MATGWLAGTVKEVPSGDTLVICSSKGLEKRLTLASLIAPRLVRHDQDVIMQPVCFITLHFFPLSSCRCHQDTA